MLLINKRYIIIVRISILEVLLNIVAAQQQPLAASCTFSIVSVLS